MALGLRYKDQLPSEGKVRDEFEQLVTALNLELDTLRTTTVVEVTNFIVSVQEIEITIPNGSASASGTLTTPVDQRYTEVVLLGYRTDSATATSDGSYFAYASALSAVALTATRDLASATAVTVRFRLTQYRASALRSNVQMGTADLTGVTSKTVTVQAVGPKHQLSCTGWGQSEEGGGTVMSAKESTIEYTDSVTLTAKRTAAVATAHVGYCLVDFN